MRILILFILVLFQATPTIAAPSRKSNKALVLESQIKDLRGEITELKLSVESLNMLSDRLTQDFTTHEGDFKSKLTRVIIHLMQWPEKRWGGNAASWTELQRVGLVLESVRQELIRSPLKMMAERELRLSEVERLKTELAAQMEELEAKQALLDFQLEELKVLDRRVKRKISHATGKTKKIPEGAELEE